MAGEPKSDAIDAVRNLLDWFYTKYGPGWTLVLIFGVPVAIFIWQVYSNWRKDQEVDKALAAKEETIQRLADDNRLMRIEIFRRLGWTNAEIERHLSPPSGGKENRKK